MIVWICTDMEGVAGIDKWEQCYDPDDRSPDYRYGCEQLTADVNAAIAGCFDAGATEVRVMDGHGRNRNKGFVDGRLDSRAKKVWIENFNPIRFEGLDASVHAVAMVGQHSMAGTLHGFLDHTQSPKEVCRYLINGQEHGEMSQFALYAGSFGVPLVYVSGDEALCAEARRLFPGVMSTPTKRGTSWSACELYPVEKVRAHIRADLADALRQPVFPPPWQEPAPVAVTVELAWTGSADQFADLPGVERPHPRTVRWQIDNPRDIYCWPTREWTPKVS
jgi:D-amino peptidase